VAVVSRDRPKMVGRLLASFREILIPAGTEVTLLLVENGDGSVLAPVAEVARVTPMPYQFEFEVEPRLGISSARNRALAYAISNGFDRLAFVDDDETTSPGWLNALLDEMQRTGAELVGGPVRPLVRSPLTLLEAAIWRGYARRSRRLERRALRQKRKGLDSEAVIVTNNWLLDLNFCRRNPVAFDERFNLSGGEDTAFYRSFRQMGGKSRWAPGALVFEEVPKERLSPRYQLARNAGSTATRLGMRSHGALGKVIEPSVLVIVKTLVASVLLAMVPITLGATLYGAIRNFGIATGAALALLGKSSVHYATTTGE